MVCYVFYSTRDQSQQAAESFAEELQKHGVTPQLIDTDTANGSASAEQYDVLDRPAAVLAREDGSEVERWPHELPPVTDVAYLAHGV